MFGFSFAVPCLKDLITAPRRGNQNPYSRVFTLPIKSYLASGDGYRQATIPLLRLSLPKTKDIVLPLYRRANSHPRIIPKHQTGRIPSKHPESPSPPYGPPSSRPIHPTMSTNYSIYAIPAFWLLALLPHNYAIYTITAANNGQWDNSNPRSSTWDKKLQAAVPAACFRRYERAEAAHKNGMENLALFATAVVLGNMAALEAGTLNTVAGAVLALRALYTIVYVTVGDSRKSYARTGIWAASVGCCFYLIVKAGNVLAVR
ncbi:hypothetical protein MMC27_000509 [Xylographa pallens]|nr:hypothetical protein [Xylographa pallens]